MASGTEPRNCIPCNVLEAIPERYEGIPIASIIGNVGTGTQTRVTNVQKQSTLAIALQCP